MTVVDLLGRRLVLASASPRRSELLRSVGVEFDVAPADIDESQRPGEAPAAYVARLSLEKATAVADRIDRGDAIVVAADTTVDVDGRILEKPVDDADARRMLTLLSGRTHLAHTGVTVLGSAVGDVGGRTIVVETAVTFVELSERAIEWYLSTGEHRGKAGAYGIQGAAGAFVQRIDGSITNVIGLPLADTLALLDHSTRNVPRFLR